MHGAQEEKDEIVIATYTLVCDTNYGVSKDLLDKAYSDVKGPT